MKKYFISIVLLSFSMIVFSQNPHRQKWKQINIDRYRIIFPAELQDEGKRVASLIEYLYKPITWDLKGEHLNIFTGEKEQHLKMRKWSIILNNSLSEANGYVAMAPHHSMWFSTPPNSSGLLGIDDWYTTLASHEGRHIVQYDKLTSRNIWSRIIGGESFQAFIANASTPGWLFEGDAVSTETYLSLGGRGRMPSFSRTIRTILLSNTNSFKIKYPQFYLGSYKNDYPNYYDLGFYLTTYLKTNYGAENFEKILQRTSKKWDFSRSMRKIIANYYSKKTIGNKEYRMDKQAYLKLRIRSNRELFNKVKDDLISKWTAKLDDLDTTKKEIISDENKKTFINYETPVFTEEGNIIFEKNGYENAPAIYLTNVKTNKTSKLVGKQYGSSGFTYSKGKIVWTENTPNKRWIESYSNIVVFDIKSKKKREITKQAKFIYAVISAKADKVAAVEFSTKNKCSLVIFNLATKKEMGRYSFENNDYIMQPSWNEDDTKITFTLQNNLGKKISVLDIGTGKNTDITDFGTEDISKPIFYNNYILYNSPFSGVDGIYAINTENKERYRIISSKYGAYNPSIDNTKIIYMDFTNSNGFNIAQSDFNTNNWQKLADVKNIDIKYYEPLLKLANNKEITAKTDIPIKDYKIEKYSKTGHLLNIHSWGFLPILDFNSNNGLNMIVQSTDVMNTMDIGASAMIRQKGLNDYQIYFNYKEFFPIISGYAGIMNRETNYYQNNNRDTLQDNWQEKYMGAMITLPFDLSKSIYSRYLDISVGINYNSVSNINSENYNQESDLYNIKKGSIAPVFYQMSLLNIKQSAVRDLGTWGQAVSAGFVHTPIKNDYNAEMFVADASFLFPGILKHHGLAISNSFEKHNKDKENNYYLPSFTSNSRGYNNYYFDNFYKFSADYDFPIAYPDLNLSWFAYFKRLRANIFYDYAIGFDNNNFSKDFSSVGAGLSVDFNLFNAPYLQFNFGFGFLHKINENKSYPAFTIANVYFPIEKNKNRNSFFDKYYKKYAKNNY